MSINAKSPAHSKADQLSSIQVTPAEKKKWHRLFLSPLWLCLLLALIVRVWVVIRTQGFIEGDEVLTGIQAQHILRGDFPIYFYGQPYMGSLEAYFIAPILALLGSSSWTLRIEPVLLSLLLVGLTWRFAGVLADGARLSSSVRRFFTTVAALIAALPPLYDVAPELHTWGGYIETFILILLLLTSALRLTQRWQVGASRKELAWRWAGIGFLVGLGFWVYPLIISAVVAAAVWILGYTILASARAYRQQTQEKPPAPSLALKPLKDLLLAVLAIPTALLGFTPALIWGAQHDWANITYILSLGGGVPQRLGSIKHVASTYITCIGPHVISGALPGEASNLALAHLPLLILGAGCIFGSLALVLASFLKEQPLLVQARNLAALPLVFGIWTAISFCTGKSSVFALISCGYDPVGRYATPLVLVLPFFYATIFTILFQLWTRKTAQETTPAQPQSRSRSWLVAGTLFGVLFCSLALQAFTYQQADIVHAFESPYCHQAPVNDAVVVQYLQMHHIRYAWSTNWIAYRIVFETNSQIIVADAMPFIPPVVNYDRIPANAVAVRHADRPSLIIFVPKSDPHPPLLSALDQAGVTYRAARFSAVSDTDILIVTPLNRTVSPFESPALSSNFASCTY